MSGMYGNMLHLRIEKHQNQPNPPYEISNLTVDNW